jgi:hypothetical protein
MKKAHVGLIMATGLYGVFMAIFFSLRQGFPGGIGPAVIASVIYVILMFVFLRRRTT